MGQFSKVLQLLIMHTQHQILLTERNLVFVAEINENKQK